MKKVSIVTINYNNADGLIKTIDSVVNQTFNDFEYIIIDGASTDRSLQIIKSYEQNINHWISEKDNGVYHAMNKGLAIARGEYVLMLNSGDFLVAHDVLEKVFANNPATDIIYTNLLEDHNGNIIERHHPSRLTFRYFKENFLSHQATFVRRELHTIVGKYDENLRIASDWKFLILAICKYNATYIHLPMVLSHFEGNGMSSDPESWRIILAERQKVIDAEFSAFLPDYLQWEETNEQLNALNKQLLLRIHRRIIKYFKPIRTGKPQ